MGIFPEAPQGKVESLVLSDTPRSHCPLAPPCCGAWGEWFLHLSDKLRCIVEIKLGGAHKARCPELAHNRCLTSGSKALLEISAT